jgi:hypothetical protein
MDLADVPEDAFEFHAFALERGWSDGLPVLPPRPSHVTAMLDGRDPAEVLGPMPPRGANVTNGLIAANAVMAGCSPAAFEVLRAAVQCMLAPEFNLLGVQTTTHPASPLVIVSGPAAELRRLELSAGSGMLGPAARGNATIGRALRLMLLNIGGAVPGVTDRATLGHPGKHAYVAAEDLDASPWGPSDASLLAGAPVADSDVVVTVLAAEGPHNVSDHESGTAADVLRTIAGAIAQTGMNNWYYLGSPLLVVLCPEHTAILVSEGLRRDDVRAALCREARIDLAAFPPGIADRLAGRRPDAAEARRAGGTIAACTDPDQVLVMTAGGPGRHSMVVPAFGDSSVVRHRVEAR